ncbi:hypothetical protein KBI23_12145 [bacterium]|nr:hypothetical protein [bacterium]MBP9810724.1 hypothetical protein [bacterium]
MSLLFKSWVILLALLVSILVLSAESQAKDGISGWKIHMETAIGGRYDIIASEKALRIDSKSFKYSLVACAPKWNLAIWRDDTKEICHCSSAQYLYQRRNAVNTTSSCTLDKIVNKHAIAIPRFGLKGIQYVYAGERRGHDLFISDKNTETVKNYFINCADINLPRPVVQLIGGTSTLPDLPGLPYQMSEILESGTRCWQVLTHTLARQTAISPKVFQPPTGYKDIGAFKHTFLFKSVSSMMDDTIDSVGIGESTGKKKER